MLSFDMFYTLGALCCVSKHFDILFMQSVFSKPIGIFSVNKGYRGGNNCFG